MLNNPDSFPDITLIFDGTSLNCHRVILASRSLYFEALFSHDFKETEQRVVNFSSHDDGVPLDSFLLMLRHIYSNGVGGADAPRVEPKHLYDLLSLADRFSVASIKRKCEHILAQHISVENVCNIFKYANTFNCERLKETCLLYTEENYQDVISSGGFEDLDKDEILKIIRMGGNSKGNKGGAKGGHSRGLAGMM